MTSWWSAPGWPAPAPRHCWYVMPASSRIASRCCRASCRRRRPTASAMRRRSCAWWRSRAPASACCVRPGPGSGSIWRGCAPMSACACGTSRRAAAGEAALCFDAADIGEPNLGYIAENSALLRACIDSFCAAGGTLIAGRLARLEHRCRRRAADVQRRRGAGGAAGGRGRWRAVAGARGRRPGGADARLSAAGDRGHGRAPSARMQYTAWQRFLQHRSAGVPAAVRWQQLDRVVGG